MGKTLTRILAVGAAIAINVIPGVGQAISGAIYGGLAGGAVGTAAAAALTFGQIVSGALTLGLTAFGLSSLGGLLGAGPKAPKSDATETAKKTSRPPRVSAYGQSRLYGAWILYDTASDGTALDAFAIHQGEVEEVLSFYLNDDAITLTGNVVDTGADERYQNGVVEIHWTTGVDPGTAIAALTAKFATWDSTFRGDGVVILAQLSAPVKSKDFIATYPNGVPIPSMVAKWQKCPDPYAEDPTDETAWTWTENSIRHALHYLIKREQVDYATELAPVMGLWQTASDVCDEDISLDAGGTEKRYRSLVSHNHDATHGSVKAAIMETCDGWLARRGDGCIVVYAGDYSAPTFTIGPDEILSFEWSYGVDDDVARNELVCTYISADHDYNQVDADAWRDEADITARGKVLSTPFNPQVPSHGQSRRLAKRQMTRSLALNRGTVTTNIAGEIALGQRYVTLDLTDAGTTFFNGPAEIVDIKQNKQMGGVTFSWIEVDTSIDDWNPATEEGNAAASGTGVTVSALTAPTITSASFVDGPRLSIDITSPDRTDLTWFVQWRENGAAEWGDEEVYSDAPTGTSITLVSGIITATTDVDVRVAYLTGDGRRSPWSTAETATLDQIIYDGGDSTGSL